MLNPQRGDVAIRSSVSTLHLPTDMDSAPRKPTSGSAHRLSAITVLCGGESLCTTTD